MPNQDYLRAKAWICGGWAAGSLNSSPFARQFQDARQACEAEFDRVIPSDDPSFDYDGLVRSAFVARRNTCEKEAGLDPKSTGRTRAEQQQGLSVVICGDETVRGTTRNPNRYFELDAHSPPRLGQSGNLPVFRNLSDLAAYLRTRKGAVIGSDKISMPLVLERFFATEIDGLLGAAATTHKQQFVILGERLFREAVAKVPDLEKTAASGPIGEAIKTKITALLAGNAPDAALGKLEFTFVFGVSAGPQYTPEFVELDPSVYSGDKYGLAAGSALPDQHRSILRFLVNDAIDVYRGKKGTSANANPLADKLAEALKEYGATTADSFAWVLWGSKVKDVTVDGAHAPTEVILDEGTMAVPRQLIFAANAIGDKSMMQALTFLWKQVLKKANDSEVEDSRSPKQLAVATSLGNQLAARIRAGEDAHGILLTRIVSVDANSGDVTTERLPDTISPATNRQGIFVGFNQKVAELFIEAIEEHSVPNTPQTGYKFYQGVYSFLKSPDHDAAENLAAFMTGSLKEAKPDGTAKFKGGDMGQVLSPWAGTGVDGSLLFMPTGIDKEGNETDKTQIGATGRGAVTYTLDLTKSDNFELKMPLSVAWLDVGNAPTVRVPESNNGSVTIQLEDGAIDKHRLDEGAAGLKARIGDTKSHHANLSFLLGLVQSSRLIDKALALDLDPVSTPGDNTAISSKASGGRLDVTYNYGKAASIGVGGLLQSALTSIRATDFLIEGHKIGGQIYGHLDIAKLIYPDTKTTARIDLGFGGMTTGGDKEQEEGDPIAGYYNASLYNFSGAVTFSLKKYFGTSWGFRYTSAEQKTLMDPMQDAPPYSRLVLGGKVFFPLTLGKDIALTPFLLTSYNSQEGEKPMTDETSGSPSPTDCEAGNDCGGGKSSTVGPNGNIPVGQKSILFGGGVSAAIPIIPDSLTYNASVQVGHIWAAPQGPASSFNSSTSYALLGTGFSF